MDLSRSIPVGALAEHLAQHWDAIIREAQALTVRRAGKPDLVVLPLAELESLLDDLRLSRSPHKLAAALAAFDRDAGRTSEPVRNMTELRGEGSE